ncbi:hypothetical protein AKJ16_DCAP02091 [Drosera capensis]
MTQTTRLSSSVTTPALALLVKDVLEKRPARDNELHRLLFPHDGLPDRAKFALKDRHCFKVTTEVEALFVPRVIERLVLHNSKLMQDAELGDNLALHFMIWPCHSKISRNSSLAKVTLCAEFLRGAGREVVSLQWMSSGLSCWYGFIKYYATSQTFIRVAVAMQPKRSWIILYCCVVMATSCIVTLAICHHRYHVKD